MQGRHKKAIPWIASSKSSDQKAIFDPENPFLTNSIDDITSYNMRYYVNLLKLRLRVSTIKKASCARLPGGKGF